MKDGSNICIKFNIIGTVFAVLVCMLFSKTEVNAQTFYRTDISITEEVEYQSSAITVSHDSLDGKWYYIDKDGTAHAFDEAGYSTVGYDTETYLHFREALYDDGVLFKFRHIIYFFPSDVEYVTMPANVTKLNGTIGNTVVRAVQYTIETDVEQVVTAFRYEKYFDGTFTYPQNRNYLESGYTELTEKDTKFLTVGYGGSILDSEGNDFFRITPQGTIAKAVEEIPMNPLTEIVKVLPMAILFLIGYLGFWKAFGVFRKLLRRA